VHATHFIGLSPLVLLSIDLADRERCATRSASA